MKQRIENLKTLTLRPYFTWFFLLSLCAATLCYIYFLERMIFDAAEIRELSGHVGTMTSTMNDLEVRYLSLKAGVTRDKATELGFREIDDIRFISKKSLGKLSFQNEI